MHLQPFILASVITAVSAAELKVNYYSDGGCTNYLTSIWPGDVGRCYDYDYTNTNSANIANCNGYQLCTCSFYSEKGCKGKEEYRIGSSCASNWGTGWASMKCSGIW
ncbi:uncharacterized protein BDW43DRAFT_310713 [Aspergillus alliaceus]|uniref:uncharacterized protein n=1 Tax=Petromyces alliaceus TaxID=209559 RepID=UPI0012A60BFB|nr:uncharacterized protein BDW43DRAFT_310713 [Aspergillus alliaceus]KAB8234040.1 hypothetical protein BDW43DRAFT_310713 [Aspergillus alliaceus]